MVVISILHYKGIFVVIFSDIILRFVDTSKTADHDGVYRLLGNLFDFDAYGMFGCDMITFFFESLRFFRITERGDLYAETTALDDDTLRTGALRDVFRRGCELSGSGAPLAMGVSICRFVETEDFEFHGGGALFDETDILRRLIGEVDDTIFDKGAAVVDAYGCGFAVFEVGYFDDGIDRECFVRSSIGVHVVAFTVGGETTVKVGPIPACGTAKPFADGDGRRTVGGSRDTVGFHRRTVHVFTVSRLLKGARSHRFWSVIGIVVGDEGIAHAAAADQEGQCG